MTIIEYDNRVKAALTISYVSPHARESRWHIQLEKAKLLVHPETFVQNSLSPRESAKANDIASNRLGRFTGSPVHRFTGSSNPSCIYLFKDNANLRVPWKIPMSYPPSEENLFFYDDYKNDPLHPGSVAQWNSFYESVFNKKVRSKTGLEIALEDIKVTEAICKSIKLQRIIAL